MRTCSNVCHGQIAPPPCPSSSLNLTHREREFHSGGSKLSQCLNSHVSYLSALWRSTPTRNLFLKEFIIGGQNYTEISKKLHTIRQLHTKKKSPHIFFPNCKPPILKPYPRVHPEFKLKIISIICPSHLGHAWSICVYVLNIDTLGKLVRLCFLFETHQKKVLKVQLGSTPLSNKKCMF